jgi:hypothetical protein
MRYSVDFRLEKEVENGGYLFMGIPYYLYGGQPRPFQYYFQSIIIFGYTGSELL